MNIRFTLINIGLAILLLISSTIFNLGIVFCTYNGGKFQFELANNTDNCSDCPNHSDNPTEKEASNCCLKLANTSSANLTSTKISLEKTVKTESANLLIDFYQFISSFDVDKKPLAISSHSDPTLAELHFKRSVILLV